jgi:hypothetical protein
MGVKECGCVITWCDGSTTTCHQPITIEAFECYYHAKCFSKVLLADGEYHWQSRPAPSDLKPSGNSHFEKSAIYQTGILSKNRGVSRTYGGEYSE